MSDAGKWEFWYESGYREGKKQLIDIIQDESVLVPDFRLSPEEQVRHILDRLAFYFAQTYNRDEEDELRAEREKQDREAGQKEGSPQIRYES